MYKCTPYKIGKFSTKITWCLKQTKGVHGKGKLRIHWCEHCCLLMAFNCMLVKTIFEPKNVLKVDKKHNQHWFVEFWPRIWWQQSLSKIIEVGYKVCTNAKTHKKLWHWLGICLYNFNLVCTFLPLLTYFFFSWHGNGSNHKILHLIYNCPLLSFSCIYDLEQLKWKSRFPFITF